RGPGSEPADRGATGCPKTADQRFPTNPKPIRPGRRPGERLRLNPHARVTWSRRILPPNCPDCRARCCQVPERNRALEYHAPENELQKLADARDLLDLLKLVTPVREKKEREGR
ncbi:hypothetical protein, partial [Nocardia mangyaensis]|uniref:hypothetical protein n=1 Tax=Nocardia mangyaensis TaxID=2213200 RepID=UPI0026751A57